MNKEEKIAKGIERAQKKFIKDNDKREKQRVELLKKGLCEICKKNKSTMTFSESMMDFIHGFKQEICQECYDEIIEGTVGYEVGYKKAIKDVIEIFNKLELRRQRFGLGKEDRCKFYVLWDDIEKLKEDIQEKK